MEDIPRLASSKRVGVEELSTSSPAITLADISHAFRSPDGNRFDVLTGVSFDIADNELCVVVGPSCCPAKSGTA